MAAHLVSQRIPCYVWELRFSQKQSRKAFRGFVQVMCNAVFLSVFDMSYVNILEFLILFHFLIQDPLNSRVFTGHFKGACHPGLFYFFRAFLGLETLGNHFFSRSGPSPETITPKFGDNFCRRHRSVYPPWACPARITRNGAPQHGILKAAQGKESHAAEW